MKTLRKPATSRKTGDAQRRRLERMVGLLVKAAEAQDDLATTYREMKWDCAADTAELEASDLRRRAEKFATEAKQPNDQAHP